jgi:NDP-sugar pyrophosphorylase family protein
MVLSSYDFFGNDIQNDIFRELTADTNYIWEILPKIGIFLEKYLQKKQILNGFISEGVYISKKPFFIHEKATIEPGAYIEGPAYIGENVVIRHGAYVRENVILLEGSILGHASEAKNSLFLPEAHAPHFNYVGDSILGSNVNLGAGTKLSNLTVVSSKDKETGKRPTIKINIKKQEYDTGLTKLGAILGNNVQTGCNSVLNPGCLIGQNSLVYANISLRKGYYPPNKIIKLRQDLEYTNRKSDN